MTIIVSKILTKIKLSWSELFPKDTIFKVELSTIFLSCTVYLFSI